GFDLGNSPLEYSAEVVAEKRIILCTSNGTKALKEAQNAAEILIGAFLNAGRTSLYLKDKQEVVLFCAGRNGELGLDDLLCAGLIVENLLAQEVEVELTDAAQLGLIS
ncbi:MAG TPA: 2-phosphosulfolactate phosphatase, partial [Firmicutes bacterium]|nr:2-phosphosulfolactate phosphatase [Bacillota bacterium]